LPVHQSFPLAKVAQALDLMKANGHFGKIAIVM